MLCGNYINCLRSNTIEKHLRNAGIRFSGMIESLSTYPIPDENDPEFKTKLNKAIIDYRNSSRIFVKFTLEQPNFNVLTIDKNNFYLIEIDGEPRCYLYKNFEISNDGLPFLDYFSQIANFTKKLCLNQSRILIENACIKFETKEVQDDGGERRFVKKEFIIHNFHRKQSNLWVTQWTSKDDNSKVSSYDEKIFLRSRGIFQALFETQFRSDVKFDLC